MRRTRWKPWLLRALAAAALAATAWRCAAPESRTAPPPGGPTVSGERTLPWAEDSAYAREVVRFWAERPLGDWRNHGKVDEPRILLARLHSGRETAAANEYLLGLRPWGNTGSTWPLHPRGDYDFTLTVLTSILWLHGGDESRLSAAARGHLLDVLLTEEGGGFRETVPRSLGRVRETENHILMTEGSRYLKNRWLHLHGDPDPRFDNTANGMEEKLLGVLDGLAATGLHEFNSQPYIAYTLAALLNLEAFASDAVRSSARGLLDGLNLRYALGSHHLRHFPPFRRRDEYADATALGMGYQTSFMKAWLSFAPGRTVPRGLRKPEATHALTAVCLPYRPPDDVVRLATDKGGGYFARLGHGPGASPEIYSAGRGFLLGAGGVRRGARSQVVARPITLLLDDGAADLSEVFHLAGPGTDFRGWNNTGVHRGFACAAGPVRVPERFRPLRTSGAWSLYAPVPGVWVAVYSTAELGLLVVLETRPAEDFLDVIVRANPDGDALKRRFRFPDGRLLEYEPRGPRDRWVMVSAGGAALDRDFDQWPLLTLDP